MPKKVRISVDVDPDLRDELKIFASLHKTPMQTLIVRQIVTLLKASADDPASPYSSIANKSIVGDISNGR